MGADRTAGRVTASQIAGGIGGIILLPGDVGLHVGCWDHPCIMAQLSDLAGPVMRRGTRLHANDARRELGEEAQHLLATQLFLKHWAALCICPMDLENPFCQIKPHCRDLVHG